MADDTMQLPPGYEDAKPVQQKLQLPPGYEDAQPVAAKTVYAGPKAGQITPPPAAQQPTLEGAQRASGSVMQAREDEAPGTVGEQQAIAQRAQQHPVLNAVGKGIEKANDVAGSMAQAGAKFGKTVAQAPVVAASAFKELPQVLEQAITPRMGSTPNLEDPEAIANREHPIAMGVTGAAGGMVGGMVADPRQWPLLFLGGETVGPIIQRAISAGFGANMAKETIEGAKQLGANWDNLNPEERAEQITSLGLSDVFAGMAGAHVMGGEAGARTGYNAVRDKVNPIESPELKTLSKETAKAGKLYDIAKAAMDQYRHSLAQGVNPPERVLTAYDKAAQEFAIAKFHEEVAREADAKAMGQRRAANVPAVQPQPPTKEPGKVTAPAPEAEQEPEITSKPAAPAEPTLGKLGAPKAPPTVSPAHATTTIPQAPTAAPEVGYRTMQLPGGEPVGKQLQLTEGTPEGPQAPKGGFPKINIPEEKPVAPKAAKPERGNLRDLKVDETGKVVEKDAEGERLHQLLIESLKNTKGNENFPAATVEKPAAKAEEAPTTEHRGGERRQETTPVEEERRTGERRNAAGLRVDAEGNPTLSPDVEGHWQAGAFGEKPVEDIGAKAREANPEPTRAETKPVLPKEEPTGYAAKKEEVVPAGSEGREPVKSAAEYHPAVQQKVGELSDTNLKQLAKAHGLNPDEYDFNARDERRHRTERDQLAKDITAEMGEDEKINLGRAADATEKQGLFQGADTSAKGRAARAEKMFPRLRGPVDENGNPKVSGGAPEANTQEAADKDNEHFANAKKELGPKASISEVAKRAQEMKDAAKATPEKDAAFTHSSIADWHNEHKGFSYNPKQGFIRDNPVFSVAGEFKGPDYEKIVKGEKITDADVKEFMERPKVKEALEANPDLNVGGWNYNGDANLELSKMFKEKDEAIAEGKRLNQDSIYDHANRDTIKTGGTAAEELNKPAFPNKIERPTVDTPKDEKPIRTGKQLIKLYGEAKSFDPKAIAFILDDGKKVSNLGSDHDTMLGGKASATNPPRERFVQQGNIRVREHQGAGGRTVAFSIPESGVNAAQWEVIKKMAPQLASGGVAFEIGQVGGKYATIPHGEATPERMQQSINEVLGKTTGEAPKSLGSAAAGTAFGKEAPLTAKPTRFNPDEFENEESGLGKLGEKKKKSPYGKL